MAIKIHFRPKLHIHFPSRVVLLTTNHLSIVWFPEPFGLYPSWFGWNMFLLLWNGIEGVLVEPGAGQGIIFNKIDEFLVKGTLKRGSVPLKSPKPASWEMYPLFAVPTFLQGERNPQFHPVPCQAGCCDQFWH